MVTFLSGYMSLRAAKLIGWVLVPLLVLGAFYLALDAYGDSRFREGRAKEEAAWKAANDRLVQQAAEASTQADRMAVARAMDHAAQVEEEKERIDDAIANGSSPFDVLFHTTADGVRAEADSNGNQAAR
jgi:predicted DNA repair protein MutK